MLILIFGAKMHRKIIKQSSTICESICTYQKKETLVSDFSGSILFRKFRKQNSNDPDMNPRSPNHLEILTIKFDVIKKELLTSSTFVEFSHENQTLNVVKQVIAKG